jgi:carboxymethylenebutenolidase
MSNVHPSLRAVFTIALCAASACRRSPASMFEAGPGALAPQEVTYAVSPGTLRGFLYRPEGTGPFPAVVFNHGSEQDPGDMLDEARFYVPRGFVLFAPHRRGQGRSAAAGESIDEGLVRVRRNPDRFVEWLDAQVEDVAAAVSFVRALPYVDADRVALVGCSFGGIETLLAAERGLGLRAAIDFAGAAYVWAKTPPLQERMVRAARATKVPMLFVQAENDFDTTPSRVLSDEMRRAGGPAKLRIFPPQGTTTDEGHQFCVGSADPVWGPEVLDFLREAMSRTADAGIGE